MRSHRSSSTSGRANPAPRAIWSIPFSSELRTVLANTVRYGQSFCACSVWTFCGNKIPNGHKAYVHRHRGQQSPSELVGKPPGGARSLDTTDSRVTRDPHTYSGPSRTVGT